MSIPEPCLEIKSTDEKSVFSDSESIDSAAAAPVAVVDLVLFILADFVVVCQDLRRPTPRGPV